MAFPLPAPAWPPEAPRVPVPGPGLLSQWLEAWLGRVLPPPPPRVTARDRILQQWGFCHPETHPRIFSAVSRDPQMHALLCSAPPCTFGGVPRYPKRSPASRRCWASPPALRPSFPVLLCSWAALSGWRAEPWWPHGHRRAFSPGPLGFSKGRIQPGPLTGFWALRWGMVGCRPGHGPYALTAAAVLRATSVQDSSREEGRSQAGRPRGPSTGCSQTFSLLTLRSLRKRSLLPGVYSVQSN